MKHLDLFSGIGGASLAVDTVYGKENVEHIFCEIDPFCQNVLKKHWSNAKIHGDIRTLRFNSDPDDGRPPEQELKATGHQQSNRRVDILTGGFPCQPFSQAGRRKGTSDNRFLWPEMLRVIREFKPRWVVGENVAGLLSIEQGLVFETVCSDLEKEGYEVQPFVIPACSVGAPHRRDRVWIIAHATGERWNDGFNNRKERHIPTDQGTSKESESERQRRERGTGTISADASDPDFGQSRSRNESESIGTAQLKSSANRSSNWDENWLEIATRLCRVDDGVSDRVVRLPDGRKISRSKWRQEALKGLGNAWVPQVATEIFKGIKEIDS